MSRRAPHSHEFLDRGRCRCGALPDPGPDHSHNFGNPQQRCGCGAQFTDVLEARVQRLADIVEVLRERLDALFVEVQHCTQTLGRLGQALANHPEEE